MLEIISVNVKSKDYHVKNNGKVVGYLEKNEEGYTLRSDYFTGGNQFKEIGDFLSSITEKTINHTLT